MDVPPPPPPFGGPSLQTVQPLPEGWTEYRAPTGQPYFYHAASGTSTYVRPVLPGTGNEPPPPPPGFSGETLNGSAGGAAAATAIAGAPKKEKKKKKEKPVEKLPIEGTPWLRVTTNEGNVFFTNTDTKTSVWTVPEGIREQVAELERRKEQEAQDAQAESSDAHARLLLEKEAEMQRLREELEQEREASRKRKLEEEEEHERRAAEDAEQQQQAKRARTTSVQVDDDDQDGAGPEEQVEEQEEELEEWQKDELKVKADLERELETPAPSRKAEEYSSEEGIALFKTMLSETDINPMKPWDMELPKFINDSRYKAVKSLRERRDLFDEHCKHKIRENRARKNAAGQVKQDPAAAYRALLTSEVTSTRTHWEDFKKKYKKDARFREFGRDDREKERAFRVWLRELGEIKRADAHKAEEKFTQMLSERTIPEGSKWSDVKNKFSADARYSAVQSSSQREEIFKKYLATRATSSAVAVEDPEESKRKAEEARRAKQAASLREREEKVRKEKEALDRVAGRSRAEAGREGAEREFKALLIDAIRDHDASWHDMLPTLEQDPRFSASTLSTSEKRRMFDVHQDEVYDKRIGAVERLFASSAPTLKTPFPTVYPKISSDPNVTRLGMSEVRIEKLFDEWSKRRYTQAKKDFEAMLNESNFVDYWGRLKQEAQSKEDDRTKDILGKEDDGDDEMNLEEGADLKTMAAQIDIKELQAVLKHDKRFTIFDYDTEIRESWIREHLAHLGRPKQSVHQR